MGKEMIVDTEYAGYVFVGWAAGRFKTERGNMMPYADMFVLIHDVVGLQEVQHSFRILKIIQRLGISRFSCLRLAWQNALNVVCKNGRLGVLAFFF